MKLIDLIFETKIGNTEILENPSKQEILDYSQKNSIDEYRYVAAQDKEGKNKHFYVWPTFATKVLHHAIINRYGLDNLVNIKGIFSVKLGQIISKIYEFEKQYKKLKKDDWNWTGINFI